MQIKIVIQTVIYNFEVVNCILRFKSDLKKKKKNFTTWQDKYLLVLHD